MQLTFDGREVSLADATSVTSKTPLTDRQKDVLAYTRLRNGLIRPVQAGIIVHSFRSFHPAGDPGLKGEPVSCCKYASSDGCDALKRLIHRGLVEKISKGLYSIVGWSR
jgi:hypothetical protein